MNRISFEGIGELAATFAAEDGVKPGQVVKLSGNGTVAPCGDGEAFCGVALSCGDGFAAVQLRGFARLPMKTAAQAGRRALVADGAGGVKEGSAGETYLIVTTDGADVTALL